MFVRINDKMIVNTDQIILIGLHEDETVIKLSDGSVHTVTDKDYLNQAIKIINRTTKNASYV